MTNLSARIHPPDATDAERQPPGDCSRAEERLIERLALRTGCQPGEFLRDQVVGPYRLRLYCPAARLAVEIEACDSRASGAAGVLERADAETLRRAARDSFLQSVGIEVLRVSEDEIGSTVGLEALITRIARRIERRMRAQRERERAGRRPENAVSYAPLAPGSSLA